MTWLIQAFGFLASSAFLKPLLTRVAISLGIGTVTYAGVSVGAAAIWSNVNTNLNSLPADAVAILSIMGIPKALNVIISAYTASMAIKGLTAGGAIKRAVWRPGQSGDLFGAG